MATSMASRMDVLLGTVDAVGVCNNVFEFHAFQTRGQIYSNLLDIPGFPIYPNTFDGMYDMEALTYYRFLPVGFLQGTVSDRTQRISQLRHRRSFFRSALRCVDRKPLWMQLATQRNRFSKGRAALERALDKETRRKMGK